LESSSSIKYKYTEGSGWPISYAGRAKLGTLQSSTKKRAKSDNHLSAGGSVSVARSEAIDSKAKAPYTFKEDKSS
jgi:hypothetical protein